MGIKTNDLKKGARVKLGNFGNRVEAVLADNMRGNTRVAMVYAGAIGLFDEMGSIYSHDMTYALIDEQWTEIEHTPAQKNLKQLVSALR